MDTTLIIYIDIYIYIEIFTLIKMVQISLLRDEGTKRNDKRHEGGNGF